MKLIFLDFDGVLNSRANLYRGLDPANVRQLNDLVQRSGAAVVISSTWRHKGLSDCQGELLAAGFVGRIIGCTPDLDRREGGVWLGFDRGAEIAAWLADRGVGLVESFVILDDAADMGELLPRLVQTDTNVGLQPADVERALALLNGGG